ncbi:B12-binding domain-containing radical SAM protein [Candidatus Omnitrophota bacterium]
MKILLVKPYSASDHIQPSLGLGYLATAVRGKHDVKILDCIKRKVTIEKLPRFLKRFKPDVLGLQCYTFDMPYVKRAFRIAKRVRKDMVTVVGGPHPSAVPEEVFGELKGSLDYLFIGEAEVGFSRLMDALQEKRTDLSGIPGLAWRKAGAIRKSAQVFTDDIDSLGLPAWDIIRPETYPESQHGAFFKKFPIAPVMITRGCPFSCTFCAAGVVSGKKVRKRSIDSVLGEIRLLYDDFGIREFHIIDDNFTMDKAYAKEFLKRLKALSLDISLAVPNGVRMDTLDEEMLILMKEAGLYLISLGIESGSDRILRLMKKSISTSKIRECVKMINDSGIDAAGFFILGFPGDTIWSMLKTLSFSLQLDLARANFFTYLPFPGTESYRQLKEAGELDNVNWEEFYFTNASYCPPGVSRRKLKALHRFAFARFYMRTNIVLYQIRSVQSLRHFLFLAKRCFRWIVAS